MSIKDTPDEPLAGGSAFQNAWQQVLKSYVPPAASEPEVESSPRPIAEPVAQIHNAEAYGDLGGPAKVTPLAAAYVFEDEPEVPHPTFLSQPEQKNAMSAQDAPEFDSLPFSDADADTPRPAMSDAQFASELSIARLTADQYCEEHTLPVPSTASSPSTTTDPIMNTATLESPTFDTAAAEMSAPPKWRVNDAAAVVLTDTPSVTEDGIQLPATGYKVTDVFEGAGVICKVAQLDVGEPDNLVTSANELHPAFLGTAALNPFHHTGNHSRTAMYAGSADTLGDELAGLNDVSHNPTPPRVDLTRLARNEQFKVVTQQQSEGNRRQPGQPRPARAARPPAAPKVVKPSVPMQSEKARNYLREAMRPASHNVDGEDHINTSSSAATRLGQALEINAHIPFHHPDLGPFKSVGGLWYFVGGETQNEAFRALFGKACRMQGKNTKMRDVQGFKTIIAEATWIKVRSDSAFEKAMTESTLPFRCYYLQGELNLPVASLTEDWYMPILEEIRRTLQAIDQTGDTALFPDFSFLEARARQEKKRSRPRY